MKNPSSKHILDITTENRQGVTARELELFLDILGVEWNDDIEKYFGSIDFIPISIKTPRGFHKVVRVTAKNLEHGIVFELDEENKFEIIGWQVRHGEKVNGVIEWGYWNNIEAKGTRTVYDVVNEIEAYIREGYNYQLRPVFAATSSCTEIMDSFAYADLHKLREEIKGPDGFPTWKDAALHERLEKVKAQAQVAELERQLELQKINFSDTVTEIQKHHEDRVSRLREDW